MYAFVMLACFFLVLAKFSEPSSRNQNLVLKYLIKNVAFILETVPENIKILSNNFKSYSTVEFTEHPNFLQMVIKFNFDQNLASNVATIAFKHNGILVFVENNSALVFDSLKIISIALMSIYFSLNFWIMQKNDGYTSVMSLLAFVMFINMLILAFTLPTVRLLKKIMLKLFINNLLGLSLVIFCDFLNLFFLLSPS